MEYRRLGKSGLMVPALCFGAGTFGGNNEFTRAFGARNDLDLARRMIDTCMDAGINFFDTADSYSDGQSEEILGKSIAHLNREDILISTKVGERVGAGPNDVGASRFHILRSAEKSLRRLGTGHIDILHIHEFDTLPPMEETLRALDDLVRQGKVRYIACSNFMAWQIMKSLSISERNGWSSYVAHQAYYSLVGRDYEWELMPLAIDQGLGTLVWSPLGWGRLTGSIRRHTGIPNHTRLSSKMVADVGPQVPEDYLFTIVDALDAIAKETDKSIPQVALNWLLSKPTVSSVIIGARNEEQLRQNIAAESWRLSESQITKLNAASQLPKSYPAWKQEGYGRQGTHLSRNSYWG